MMIWLFILALFLQEETRKDPETGFVVDVNLRDVKAHCTGCHSPKLVTQNRGTEQEWRDLIVWMQEEQGLWAIDPKTTDRIVAYLAKHYGHEEDNVRRKNLVIEKDGD